jgi:sarcosine oxidase
VAGAITSSRDHGLPYELLDAGAVHQRYPHHRLHAGEIAVYDGQAGALRPEVAVRAMVTQAERHGATFHRSTAVTGIEAGAETVRITAGGQVYHARHAIVAAGAWLPRLLPDLPVPLQVERQVVASFVVDDPARFSPQRCPVFMHEVAPGHFRYGFPTLDGHTIKLGVHHEGAITTPEAVDRAVHAEDLAPLQRFVRDSMAGVTQAVARSQVCLYTNTPDEHFVVGALQRYPSLTIVSACSGHGFKFAPVIGDAAADLALDGGTDYPIDLFTPTRFLNQDPR